MACTKTSTNEAHTGRENEKEQAGAANQIYSGQRTECEKLNHWFLTRCNDCIVVF